jgi:hypothetical protein
MPSSNIWSCNRFSLNDCPSGQAVLGVQFSAKFAKSVPQAVAKFGIGTLSAVAH